MNNKKQFIAFSVVGLCLIAGISIFAFDLQKNSDTKSTNSSSNTTLDGGKKQFTTTELAKFDGLGGNKCYVAVDGKVYDLSNFVLWRNGVHSPSGGQASCGRDLTEVISKAPHGKSKLKIMPEIGSFSK